MVHQKKRPANTSFAGLFLRSWRFMGWRLVQGDSLSHGRRPCHCFAAGPLCRLRRHLPALRGVTLGEGGLKKAEQSPAPTANGPLFEGAGARSATEGVISENLLNLALQQETPSVTARGRATSLKEGGFFALFSSTAGSHPR